MFRNIINDLKPLILILISFLVFIPSMQGEFLNWDDTYYVLNNSLVYNGISFDSFMKIYHYDRHISLVLFTFLAQIKLIGTDPISFHLVNMLIHSINVVLVFKLSRLFSKSVNVSLLIAIFFAIHPMKAESVSWIIQRKDLLYSLFFLSGIVTYFRFRKSKKLVLLVLSFVLAYFAIHCKLQAIVLPFVFILIDYYFDSKLNCKSLILNLLVFLTLFVRIEEAYYLLYLYIPLILLNLKPQAFRSIKKIISFENLSFYKKFKSWFLKDNSNQCSNLFLIFCLYTLFVIINLVINFNVSSVGFVNQLFAFIPIVLFGASCCNFSVKSKFSRLLFSLSFVLPLIILIFILVFNKIDTSVVDSGFSFINRVFFATYSILYYFIKFIFPFDLNAMHIYPDLGEKLNWMFYISPALLVGIVLLIVFALKRVKDERLKKQQVFGILFFVCNISLVLHLIPIGGRVIVADRYLYLASFGLIFFIVSFFEYLIQIGWLNISKTSFTVFSIVLVFILIFQTTNRSKIWLDSEVFWSDAILNDPDNHYASYSLGLYYFDNDNFPLALEKYNVAIELDSSNYEYFANRGAVNFKLRNINAALVDYQKALALNPRDYASYYNRGVLYQYEKNFDAAINDFNNAIDIKPNYTAAIEKYEETSKIISLLKGGENNDLRMPTVSERFNKRGAELAMMGDFESAIIDFDFAVLLDDQNLNAIKNRGSANAALKEFEKAQLDFQLILSINPNDGGAYLNLANTFHETGDIDRACEYWEKALELGENSAAIMLDRFCGQRKPF